MNLPQTKNSEQQSAPSLMTSPQAASESALMTAIRSPQDPGLTLKRVNTVLALFFVPDEDFETKAGVREEFVRALSSYPNWAVQRAFDVWCRTRTRRPSPGEIVILAAAEMKPFTDEIAYRQRNREAEARERAEIAAKRCSKEAAAEILARATFTPKRMEAVRANPTSGSLDEAEERASAPAIPHWTASATEAQLAGIKASRMNNSLMLQAMADAAAQEAKK